MDTTIKSIENIQAVISKSIYVNTAGLEYINSVTDLIKQQTAIYSSIENQINRVVKYAQDNKFNVPSYDSISSYSNSFSQELAPVQPITINISIDD